MHSSALGAAALMFLRSVSSAARLSALTVFKYSSGVFGFMAISTAAKVTEIECASHDPQQDASLQNALGDANEFEVRREEQKAQQCQGAPHESKHRQMCCP